MPVRLWAAALVGGSIAWVPHRTVALVVTAEGHVKLTPNATFRARNRDVLHEPAAGGFRMLGGVEVRFP